MILVSLPLGRLPELDLVAFGVHDPPELAVLGVVCLLQHVAALLSQGREKAVQIGDAVVDHERGCTRREVVAFRAADGPDRGSQFGLAIFVGPAESRASPLLDVDA
jgi:hypothetical protein